MGVFVLDKLLAECKLLPFDWGRVPPNSFAFACFRILSVCCRLANMGVVSQRSQVYGFGCDFRPSEFQNSGEDNL